MVVGFWGKTLWYVCYRVHPLNPIHWCWGSMFHIEDFIYIPCRILSSMLSTSLLQWLFFTPVSSGVCIMWKCCSVPWGLVLTYCDPCIKLHLGYPWYGEGWLWLPYLNLLWRGLVYPASSSHSGVDSWVYDPIFPLPLPIQDCSFSLWFSTVVTSFF